MFDEKDLRQIARHGLTVEAIEWQLEAFLSGFPFLNVTRPASPGDGIMTLDAAEAFEAAARYDAAAAALTVVKFVPASGAATRMFKELFEFAGGGARTKGVDRLLDNIRRFAFWPALRTVLPAQVVLRIESGARTDADDLTIIGAIVGEGLDYGRKPKGLLAFHGYGAEVRTAIEEHIVEGAAYAAPGGRSKIHFTVSPEHMGDFHALLAEKVPVYERRHGIACDISFSVQNPSTDTIAVNPDNTPFRNDDGTLLFRPAGHGALIENLNGIDADIVFIKNIDNVTPDAQRADTILYKKVLAGLLLDLQSGVRECLDAIDTIDAAYETPAAAQELADLAAAALARIARFVEERLCVKLPPRADVVLLRSLLDRPIRVCGMVRNEGEPGGGPFWVARPDGTESLQIAEPSQIAPADRHLMLSATHFNPVDLVCWVRDYKGRKFDLRRYTDPATGFISEKSSGGRPLRAQELPGLWNGAMADWNTVFVDVPVTTFSPVKVVQDLLRAEHQ